MEKLRPKEMKCLVQGHTASPEFLPEDICQFVLDSVWRAFSFPELMDYWLMFRKMHKEVFYVPHYENFFYSSSVGTLRACWPGQSFVVCGGPKSFRMLAFPVQQLQPGWEQKCSYPFPNTSQEGSTALSRYPLGCSKTKIMKSPSSLPCPPQCLL